MSPTSTETVDLCLTCSSSLPPRRSSASKSCSPDIFVTQCCGRPICPACISKSPRLARYNPCLRCPGGVGVVNARSRAGSAQVAAKPQNIDGGLHDDEVYAIGDDDEDEDEEGELGAVPGETFPSTPPTPPPVYTELDEAAPQDADTQESGLECVRKSDKENEDTTEASGSAPSVYYIQSKDTLVGIALRFGVDGRLLCRLNNLPPSTLRITPHLLHTRTVLQLPPSARTLAPSTPPSDQIDPDYETRRARERAEKRFQTVMKETDWRIAKAYVTLAEDGDPSSLSKEDTRKKAQQDTSVEGRAMDQYLDDNEWEAQQRRESRRVHIPPFPYNPQSNTGKGKSSEVSFSRWRWR